MESIGTLAGGIAHDFNNIRALSLAMRSSPKLPFQKGAPLEFIDEIKTACLRQRRWLSRYLSSAVKSDQEFARININRVIRESINLIRPQYLQPYQYPKYS
jgi:hypothetical protein